MTILAGILSFWLAAMGQYVPAGAVFPTTAPPAVIGPVDMWLQMNTSTPGTTLTTTILGNGTVGVNGGWSLTASSGMTVAAHQSGCTLGGSLQIAGTVYSTSSTTQAIDYDNANNFKTAIQAIPANASGSSLSYTSLDYLGCVKFGVSSVAQGSAQLFDMIRFDTLLGHFAVVQLNNGNCGGAAVYGINVETDSPSNPTHSVCVTLTPGSTYWLNLHTDLTNSSGTILKVWDTSFAQVGSTVTTTNATGDTFNQVRFGNAEVGTSAGTHNIFENQMLRYAANFATPLGPQNTTQPDVYLISYNPNTSVNSGSASSTATPAIALPAGVTNLVWIGMENASATVSGCTDTAGNTYTQAATVNLATQGHGDIWYAKNTTANSSNVVTCSHTASTFRTINALAIGGASTTAPLDVTATGTQSSGADVTTGSFTPTTSTGAVVVCGYITAGVALGPGTNYQLINQSATTSQACEMRSAAPNSSQTATLKQTNTSSKWAVAVALKK